MKQLVLISGAQGQLGEAMAVELAARHEVVSLGRSDLDVTDAGAVMATVSAVCPDVIVNCAAYTDVDGAEREPTVALTTNAWALRSLARAAVEINATLVHFSTDFVFDGITERPYTETDLPNPRGTYAVSKLLGEWFAAGAPTYYVLRVESLFGGQRARSSVDKMLRNLLAGLEVRAFADRTVSPSYVDDVVAVTNALLDRRSPSGVYHCTNTGWTTWSGLARELATLLGKPDAAIVDVPMEDARLAAPRPKFAALANAKLKAAGIEIPTWQSALKRYVASLESPPLNL
jgi:dTDP-4-dehydrorhamnose reductase